MAVTRKKEYLNSSPSEIQSNKYIVVKKKGDEGERKISHECWISLNGKGGGESVSLRGWKSRLESENVFSCRLKGAISSPTCVLSSLCSDRIIKGRGRNVVERESLMLFCVATIVTGIEFCTFLEKKYLLRKRTRIYLGFICIIIGHVCSANFCTLKYFTGAVKNPQSRFNDKFSRKWDK